MADSFGCGRESEKRVSFFFPSWFSQCSMLCSRVGEEKESNKSLNVFLSFVLVAHSHQGALSCSLERHTFDLGDVSRAESGRKKDYKRRNGRRSSLTSLDFASSH